MEIDDIRAATISGNYRFSDHAVKMMIKRSIDRIEIEEAILSGEIIEEYPDDKYSPSCLIYGMTKTKRHLHVQISLPPVVIVITAYDPDENERIDYRMRRVKE